MTLKSFNWTGSLEEIPLHLQGQTNYSANKKQFPFNTINSTCSQNWESISEACGSNVTQVFPRRLVQSPQDICTANCRTGIVNTSMIYTLWGHVPSWIHCTI